MNKTKSKKSPWVYSRPHSSRVYFEERPININVDKGRYPERQELQWSAKEEKDLCTRILSLRDDQIAALAYTVGVSFAKEDIEEVVAEIRKNKHRSGHLPIIVEEANSKEDILWWVGYFEKQNKKQK